MKKDQIDEYLQTPSIRTFLNDYLSSLLRDRPADPIGYTRLHLDGGHLSNKGGHSSSSRSTSVTVSPMVLPSPSPHLPPCGLPAAPHTPHPSPYTLPTRKPAPPPINNNSSIHTFGGLPKVVDRSPLVCPSSLPLPPRNTPPHLGGTTSHIVVTPKLASFVDRRRTEALASREFDWLHMVGLSSSSAATTQIPSPFHPIKVPTSEVGCQTVEEDASSSVGGGMGSTACTREFTEARPPHGGKDDDEHEEEDEEECPCKPLPPPPPPSALAKQFPAPQTHYTLINPNTPAPTGGRKRGSKPGSPTRSDVDLFSAEFSGEGNYGTVVKGYWSQKGVGSSSSGDTCTNSNNPIAIKVVPVVSMYSLDEVAVLKRCAVAAQALATATNASSAPSSPSSSSSPTIPQLSALRNHVAMRGASSVVMLEGPCCYDVKKNALWLPMPWMPLTLEGLIKHRQKRDHHRSKNKKGSPSSATPLPPQQTKSQSLFSIEEIRSIAWQLLCAVHFLSKSVGVVHLDLKPANILLRVATNASYVDVDKALARGDTVEIGVCDFGLSQSIGGELQQLGDYSYMSPEVFWCDETTGFTPEGYEEDADPTNSVDLAIRVSEARARAISNNAAPLSSSRRSRPESSSPASSSRRKVPRVPDHADMNTFQEVHDVWSVGCILLHMLDGCPVSTWDSEDYFGALRDNYLTPFPRHPSRWPSDLLHLLSVMMEKDPRRRSEAYELLSTHPFFADITP